MSEQKQLQEEAAMLRRAILGHFSDGIKDGTLSQARAEIMQGMADLIEKIAGPPSVPLEALGAYAASDPELCIGHAFFVEGQRAKVVRLRTEGNGVAITAELEIIK